MIKKSIDKNSLVFVDSNNLMHVSLMKHRIKVWQTGFDVTSTKTINSEQAKKLSPDQCDVYSNSVETDILPIGELVAQEPLALFARAVVAGKIDDVRYFTNGCALIGGRNLLVSTNSLVLFKAPFVHACQETIIIPNKLLKLMIKMVGKKAEVKVFVRGDMVTLEANGIFAQAALISGTFPFWDSAFPDVKNEDFLIEDPVLEAKENKIMSGKGSVYSADLVKLIKKMGFGNVFWIESPERPAWFRSGEFEALLVPILY